MKREDIITILKDYDYGDYKHLFDLYSLWLTSEKVEPSVCFPSRPGEIMAIIFRCNEPVSFNDEERNNDLLVVVKIVDANNTILDFFFDVTCDPKAKAYGIAHVVAQIYRGNVRGHKFNPTRACIASDLGFGTWYVRTDSKGNVIDQNKSPDFTSVPGHIGLNIHNAAGNYNSSLGCTILSDESAYRDVYKPLLEKCGNKNNIPVLMIDSLDLEDVLKSDEFIPDGNPDDDDIPNHNPDEDDIPATEAMPV